MNMMSAASTGSYPSWIGALALLAALACCHPAIAARGLDLQPNVQFETLDVDAGLSHAMVYDFAQDGGGQLWIATQEGLNRFDGLTVEVFLHDRADARSLPNDFVRTVHVDLEGHLWVGTERGIARFDGPLEGFERAPFGALGGANALAGSIRAIAHTADGTLWFGTGRSGLVARDAESGELRSWDASSALGDDTVLSLQAAADGRLWIGTESAGVLWFDPATASFGRPDHPALDSLPAVRSLYLDDQERLWVGTDGAGALRLEAGDEGWTVERFGVEQPTDASGALPDDRVRAIRGDARGRIWLATDKGIAQWLGAQAGFARYRQDNADRRSLANDRTNALFFDASGVLWVGTWGGASRWNRLSEDFYYLDVASGHLDADIVTAAAEASSGVLWIGTYGGGLARIDPASGSKRVFRHDPAVPGSLPDDRVMAVFVDAQQRVWVGTRAAGLARLDPDAEQFVNYRHDPANPDSIAANAVTGIATDEDGRIWVGTFGAGLDRLADVATGRFEHLRHDPEDRGSLSGNRVLDLLPDDVGRLWIGTDGAGLNLLDTRTMQITRFDRFALTNDTSEPGADLELGTVTDLHASEDGSLWVATLGQGLLRWPHEALTTLEPAADLFGRTQGARSDTIYCVLPGENGSVWLSGNRGLTRVDPGDGSFRHVDARNGLRDSEFNSGACTRTRDGHLLFGGISGVVRFRPETLRFNAQPPRVRVDASSREALLATAADGDAAPSVEIGHLDPFLSFDFAALDFVSPDKNRFRYRLEGFDPNWIDAGSFRRATYSNIPAGRYVFEVEAANNDGVWSRAPARIAVLAVPAPWRSTWAYALYVAIALAAVLAYLRLQRERFDREIGQRARLEREIETHAHELAESNRELHRLKEQLAMASLTDPLTELRNRRYAERFLPAEIARFEREHARLTAPLQRADSRSLFFMRIDLDGFSQVNERVGQQIGDRIFLQARDLLQRECRDADTLVRWASDEFLVFGATRTHYDACVLAGRIRAGIADHRFVTGIGDEVRLTASIGIAPYPFETSGGDDLPWERIANIAGIAMRRAHTAGGNRWVSLAGTRQLPTTMIETLGECLDEAIEAGQIQCESSERSMERLVDAQG